ncbi:hypothetical protein IID19_01320 [Patescibacteria group bacterium]|nr:hypothetical protein [Patescibacteria group bacterium]
MKIKRKNQSGRNIDASSLTSFCALCNVSFTPKEVSVIGEGDKTQLLHVSCNHCASSIVLLLLMSELGSGSVGLITDLTEGDVRKFKDAEPISADDVLNLYRDLPSLI